MKLDKNFRAAFIAGAERVAAWSDLLDDINVFPVADGDTGRNLMISLSPLMQLDEAPQNTITKLFLSARGNSGNIAAQFFSGFLRADSLAALPEAAKTGRDLAWDAVHDPVAGTMLTVFDALVEFMAASPPTADDGYVAKLVDHLADATRSTPELLPRLQHAGVLDAGALGMFIYLEGFFKRLIGRDQDFQPIGKRFKGTLRIASTFKQTFEAGYCIDTVIHSAQDVAEKITRLSELGESVVVMAHDDYYKVHLHTDNIQAVKQQFESMGEVVRWADDDLKLQIKDFKPQRADRAVHIMTDAAGSVTREDAHRLGFTLLDSYILTGDKALPETLFPAQELYEYMSAGVKITTCQASDFERHQHYQRVLERYPLVLYLCVGSVFTGNYAVAKAWKKDNDPQGRFVVIDTTAASGRLGTIVMATARFAEQTDDPQKVIRFAERVIPQCEEYIFLDRLKYLAAGGRLSKKSAFLADVLHLKPVVSPTAAGAVKVGAVHNKQGQLRFALDRLSKQIPKGSQPFIMLEYSDNRSWVAETVSREIKQRFPAADLLLQPLSLTSGVHMGPGTWAVAFLPEAVGPVEPVGSVEL